MECILCITVFLIVIALIVLRGYGIGETYSDSGDDLEDEMYMYDTFYED